MTENWHGIDVSVNARLRNGLTVQGGTSTGRRLQDNCDVRAALPETYSWASTTGVQTTRVTTSTGALANPWCRVVEPFQTSFRGLGTYIVPKVDLNLSVHVAERPRTRPRCQLRRDERHRATRHSAAPLVRERHGQPGRARDAIRGSAE